MPCWIKASLAHAGSAFEELRRSTQLRSPWCCAVSRTTSQASATLRINYRVPRMKTPRPNQSHSRHVRRVDSSVSAYLLQEQGYQVEGLFMKTGTKTTAPNTAPPKKTWPMPKPSATSSALSSTPPTLPVNTGTTSLSISSKNTKQAAPQPRHSV